ncbi:hypothetical protein BRE01_58290 [Brevibacillus reuszeri]|uniref:Membrane protein n=1 Tax=Brevibacillus reuszeri TaxID=54915 RepID=A0A0K9YUA2_9BACL|nr:DUF3995 domain-containing protein [Brevibacillus reuszeri]KNB72261.1 membrane protein [Brevibacillus reuszeri]MED1855907.1 DUF3995 domain-containing protein [Brevibacillus reuszeri]GED72127.1 hypothetical protein BRE01_58290 [Brevibacillus reuszeri]
MITFFILSSATILLFIALLHAYWAAGGRWSLGEVIPRTSDESRRLFTPGKGPTMIISFLLALAAVLLLTQSGYFSLPFPAGLLKWGCVICATVFVLRAIGDFRYIGFFKKVRHTRFAHNDTWLFSPLCVWLGFSYVLALL